MNVKHGQGTTEFGPGVSVELTGDEVATAIDAYLVARGVHLDGPRTVTINGELCESGHVYVDPSGFVIYDGVRYPGGVGVAEEDTVGALKKRVARLEWELNQEEAAIVQRMLELEEQAKKDAARIAELEADRDKIKGERDMLLKDANDTIANNLQILRELEKLKAMMGIA